MQRAATGRDPDAAHEPAHAPDADLLAALAQSAPLALGVLDRDLRFLHANAALAALSGRPVADHPGRTVGEVFGDSLAGCVEPLLKRALETGLTGIDACPAADGGEWRATCYPVVRPDGSPAAGLLLQAPTPQAEAAAARRLEALTDALTALVVVMAADGTPTFYNQACFDYTGLSPADLADDGWQRSVHPDDLPRLAPLAVLEGSRQEVELRVRRADGAYRWHLFRLAPERDATGAIAGWVGVAVDVDDRHRAEEARREAEQLLVSVGDALPVLVVVGDAEGSAAFVNRQWSEYTGVAAPAGASASPPAETIHPDDRAQAKALFGMAGEGRTAEVRVRGADGEYRWHLARSEQIAAPGGSTFWVCAFVDIQDRKVAEDVVAESQDRLHAFALASAEIIWAADADGTPSSDIIRSWSDGHRWEDFTGQPTAEAGGPDWADHFHPDDRGRVRAQWAAAVARGQPFAIEFRARRHDGDYRTLRARAVPVTGPDGALQGWIGTATDVTERRAATEALAASERALQRRMDALPVLVAVVTPLGEPRSFNRSWQSFTGLSEAELIAGGPGVRYHPDDVEAVRAFSRSMGEVGRPGELEARIRAADGRYCWHLLRALPVPEDDGEPRLFVVTATDIHARREAESVAARLAAVITSTREVVWTMDLEGRVTSWNAAAERLYGWTAAEALGQTMPSVPADRRAAFQARVARIVAGEELETYETERLARDGRRIPMEITLSPVRDAAGAIVGVSSIGRDISEQLAARAAIAAERARLDAVLEQLPSGVIVADAETRAVETNAGFAEIWRTAEAPALGAPDASRSPGATRWPGAHLDGTPYRPEEWPLERALVKGERVQGEIIAIRRADGTPATVAVNAGPVHDASGRVIAAVATLTDVTESERTLAELAAERARLAAVIEQMPAGVVVADAQSGGILVNPRFSEIWRRTLPEGLGVVGLPPEWAGYREDGTAYRQGEWPIHRALMRGEAVNGEVIAIDRGDGTRGVMSVNATPVRDADGRLIAAIAIMSDITEREAMRARLAESEARYRLVAEATPQLAWAMDTEGQLTYMNGAYAAYVGTDVEGMNRLRRALTHRADRARVVRLWNHALSTGTPFSAEYRMRRHDGTYRWFLARAVPLRDAVGNVVEWYGTLTDIDDLRRLQEAINASEARYRHLADAMPQIVWQTVGKSSEPVYLNSRWQEYAGNDPPAGVVHPDDAAQLVPLRDAAHAAGTAWSMEYRLRRHDGAYRWHLARAVPTYDEQGALQGFVGTATDVHEQRLASERDAIVAEASRRLALSLEPAETCETAASCAVPALGSLCLVDLLEGGRLRRVATGGDLTALRPNLVAALRTAPEPHANNPVVRVVRSGQTEWATGLAGHMERLQAEPFGRRVARALGVDGYVVVPLRLGPDVIGAMTFATTDADRRYEPGDVRTAELVAERAALAIANARLYAENAENAVFLETLIKNAPVGLGFEVREPDGELRMVRINRALAERNGTSVAESLGRRVSDVVPDLWPRIQAITGQVYAMGTPVLDVEMTTARDRTWLVSYYPVPGPAGEMVGVGVVAAEVTEMKRAQATLERANVMKDEFLGLVSHELRTPLTAILGNAQVLQRFWHQADEETLRTSMEDIRREAERLQRLVENMLILAGVAGRGGVELEPILLQRLVPDAVARHTARYPGRRVDLSFEPRLPPVLAEPTYVEQVLTNLVGNAEKYSPPGSPIEIAVIREGKSVAVRVLDRGPGIRAEETELVFRAFFRSSRTAASAPGAGLGLAVCQRLVEAMGGSVWAAPRAGGGTEFGFSLPVEEEPGP